MQDEVSNQICILQMRKQRPKKDDAFYPKKHLLKRKLEAPRGPERQETR